MKATVIKRSLALLAVLVMLLSLVACTNNGDNGDTTTTTTTVVTTDSAVTTTPPTETVITDESGNAITTTVDGNATTEPNTDATDAPVVDPTDAPVVTDPTDAPVVDPTDAPTVAPTDAPTVAPTDAPTVAPTDAPTQAPTVAPTQAPTVAPTEAPVVVTTATTVATTEAPVVVTTVNQPAGPVTMTKEEVMAKMPANLKGSTITYFYWNPWEQQTEGQAVEKWKAATGCNFNFEQAAYNKFQEELNVRVTSENAPDLVRLLGPVTWQVTNLQPVDTSGFQYFNDTAWDKEVMSLYTYNGKCYALNLNNSAISDVAMLYYNIKALRDADMEDDDPFQIWKNNPNDWTWAKFWELCEKFVDAHQGESGYAGATFEYASAYIRAMGGAAYYYDPAQGLMVNDMLNPALEAGVKTTAEMMEKGLLLRNHSEISFDQGKVLFFWSGPYSARTLDARQAALKKRNRLGVVPTPTDSKKQVMYEFTAFGIPKGAKNAAIVPYYLRYVMDRSSYDWSKVYYTEEAREAVDYATSRNNRWYGYAAGKEEIYQTCFKAGSAQVKTVLDSFYNEVQTKVEQENEIIRNKGIS